TAQEARQAQKHKCHVRAEAKDRSSCRLMPASEVARSPRQLPEDQEGSGDDQNDRDRRIDLHGVPPSEPPDRVTEYRRQNRTSSGLAARDQRQGGAAPTIEPASDVDVKRRVNPGIAKKPHKEPVTEIERNPASEARQDQPGGNHHRPKDNGPAYTNALGNKPHGDTASCRTEPRERIGEGGHRADIAELCGDRLQRYNGDQRRAERN